jgi:hypothetical protein
MSLLIGSSRMIATVLMLLTLFLGTARAVSDQEGKRIAYLITSVENLQGAKFVRNGTQYDGKEAASHLRMKLGKAGDRVRSAEDFITLCASKSYLSGKPYLIVFSDGKTIPSEDFFRKKLQQYPPQAK